MAQEFRLPDIGEGLTEAEIVRWLVAEGEYVAADQPVVEVETDKAVVEIPSPYAGTVLKHGGAPGDVIEVGSVLLVVGDSNEQLGEPSQPPPLGADLHAEEVDPWAESEQPRSGDAAPIVGTLSDDAEVLAPRHDQSDSAGSSVKALPVVRKLARDQGVDLEKVHGTGPGGRITREDVLAAIEARGGAPDAAPAAPEEEPAPEPAEEQATRSQVEAGAPAEPEAEHATVEDGPAAEREAEPARVEPVEEMADSEPGPSVEAPMPDLVPQRPDHSAVSEGEPGAGQRMSRLRRTIAANMSRSWSEIPHVTTFDDIDATRLLETRAALANRHQAKIPLEALVIKAVLPALDAFPEFNATLDGETLTLHEARDIGIAVDTPDGLLVAVIRRAQEKRILELAEEVVRLGSGARERSLSPDELGGQTFTVSNIGAVGGGHGTPIVPYGTTAILSVGRARAKPVVYEGDLAIAPLLPLSLSYDHRVVDGAQGRRFMALVMENLEEPALFLAT